MKKYKAYMERGYQLKKNYGITSEQYDEILTRQDHKCAICGTFCERPFVDHDHSTGRIRGLLCMKCNFGIGNFTENITVLESAIKYLTHWSAL